MEDNEIKINDRLYHVIFGWCKVTHPALKSGKVLVDLEADEIEYYVMGKGRVTFKRDELGRHSLYTPIADLYKNEKEAEGQQSLKRLALSAKLTFWQPKI